MSSTTSMSAVWLLMLGALLGAPLVLGRSVSSSCNIADRISAEIDAFRSLMVTGNETCGIPILDPLVLDQIPINVKSSLLTARGFIDSLTVLGLSAFTVPELEQTSGQGNSGRISIAIELPSASATAAYDLKGKLSVGIISINLNERSTLSASVSGIKGRADVDVTINADDSITVEKISNVDFSYDKAKVKLNSFSWIVNNAINKLIPKIVKSNHAQIVALIQNQGKDFINAYFNLIAGKTGTKAVSTSIATTSGLFSSGIVISPDAERLIEQIAFLLKHNISA